MSFWVERVMVNSLTIYRQPPQPCAEKSGIPL